MITERLHYDDPLRLTLTSRVTEHGSYRGRESVILDRTVFYAESGGQMADRGTLGELAVIDAQIDEQGVLHHLVDGLLPNIDTVLEGRVDGARRRRHMALHTAQHALSRAVLDRCGAVTLSSRLGESACTLDVDVSGLSLETLRPVEAAVNTLVDEDRPVRQTFVDEETLARLALRKPPTVDTRVRVVDIEGFDVTPCGGTHVTHTAQIELLHLVSVERYKGGTRITFEAGSRARDKLEEAERRVRDIATALGGAAPEAVGLIEGLQQKLRDSRDEVGVLRAQLAARWAASLPVDHRRVIATLEGADRALLKAIADRLTADPAAEAIETVALAARDETGFAVLIACRDGSARGAGELLREIATRANGRGGGRPQLAEGRLPSDVDFERLVRSVLDAKA